MVDITCLMPGFKRRTPPHAPSAGTAPSVRVHSGLIATSLDPIPLASIPGRSSRRPAQASVLLLDHRPHPASPRQSRTRQIPPRPRRRRWGGGWPCLPCAPQVRARMPNPVHIPRCQPQAKMDVISPLLSTTHRPPAFSCGPVFVRVICHWLMIKKTFSPIYGNVDLEILNFGWHQFMPAIELQLILW